MATRGKRHPPPGPTPRILHLPRRYRRLRTVVAVPHQVPNAPMASRLAIPPVTARNLAALLDQERRARAATAAAAAPASTCTAAAGCATTTTGAVAASSSTSSSTLSADSGEERWRFQAEILRAECNFLRMEREVALKKLDRSRAQMMTALRSALETLVSGRKKVDGSHRVAEELDAQIASLEEKLEELMVESRIATARRRSRSRSGSDKSASVRDPQRNRARGNFDRQASVLRRHLEKMVDDNVSVKDIREIVTQPVPEKDHAAEMEEHGQDVKMEAAEEISQWSRCRRFPDMEKLKRRMEGLSNGMLERMEECSSLLLSINNNGSRRSSSGCSGQRMVGRYTEDDAEKATNHNHDHHQQPLPQHQEKQVEDKMGLLSCCKCKEVIGKILQQVRTETEQWSEMQRMLEQVRLEMDDLRSSRDLWQRRAVSSEINFHSLHTQMLDWKRKALSSEQSMNELQSVVSKLQDELAATRAVLSSTSPTYADDQFHSESLNADRPPTRNRRHWPLDSHKENEKHVLVCHLKQQDGSSIRRRSPLQDIRNIADLEFGIQRNSR